MPFSSYFSLKKLYEIVVGNIIISLMGTIPGYFLTVVLIERMGRLKIQYLGFGVLTVVFVVLAAFYNPIRNEAIALFIFLYCVGLFFFNFGPNTTTFIIPGEVFPTRYRSTGHGISAGSGKLGAMIGAYGFGPLSKTSGGIPLVLGVLSVFMALGAGFTYFVPETKGLTLEELAQDDEDDEAHAKTQKKEEKANLLGNASI
jgi:PHS family inorganic phosphate transporter-like MFS transporter